MQDTDFYASNLARDVERMTAEEIDQLPFGVIKLDAGGKVVLYSSTERVQSGYGRRPALGLDFFTHIAPCMNVPAFKGRIVAALRAGEVDVEFGWTGDFADPDRAFVVRCQSARGGGLWVFMNREANY